MAYTRVIGLAVIGVLAAAPLLARAEEGQRRRGGSERREQRAERSPRGDSRQGGERAAPRAQEPQRADQGSRPQNEQRRSSSARSDEGQRQYAVPREGSRYEPRRENGGQRYEGPRYESPRYGGGRYESQRQYDARRYEPRAIQRPYYSRGGYGPRTVIVPRYIRPSIVTIVPYRPYVYRPRFGIGVYYGDGGSYPYGYTPRGYYDPLPGRIYGGLRITDAPREAQVFADGYYLGIVDDFDGMFQHANLEAGTHRIEIQAPGFESVAFDVMVQPGRTITFRAEMYPY
jgi:PEGA domain-containing protein